MREARSRVSVVVVMLRNQKERVRVGDIAAAPAISRDI